MNDRTRKTAVNIIAVAGSSASAMAVVLFGGIQNVVGMVLLAFLAGTLGHLAFTGLGVLLMRLQKRWSAGRPGDCVYAFGRLPPQEAPRAGGKGRALADLSQRGFPVPDGCIVLPAAFDGDDITGEAWAKVKAQLARLRRAGAAAFAVRSSALSEDSAQASFAGAFESVLDVKTDEEIRAAVQAVLRSRRSARVRAYSQAQGLEAGEPGAASPMSVIVQRMVHPDYAGVLFTANPLTGDRMQMAGNFIAGLGDRLVSGQVSAAGFTFTRTAGTYHGPEELRRAAPFLHREAHEIEHVLGGPQDIEWAVSGAKVFILQSRPITTLNGFDPLTAQWNDTLKGNFLWSATNLMEACPEVLTPFTASLFPYLEQRGGPSLTVKNVPLNGVIGGRFYANISVQVTAFVRTFKGDAHRAYREIAGWWGEIPAEMKIPLLPLTRQEWQQELLPALWRTSRLFARYRKMAPEFLENNRRRCAEVREQVRQADTRAALLALWDNTILPAYRDAMIHIIAAGSDAQVRLERELRALVGADDASALLSNLSGQAGRLESLGPMAGLGQVLRGELTREEYLERYGHRGVNEGEAAWPRPMEDPHWLERQLAEWQRHPADVDALLARQRAAYAAAWERFRQEHPDKVKRMQKRLSQAAEAARRREAMRSEGTRGMTVLRAFALRAGELLGIGEDVFFLTIDELLAALAAQRPVLPDLPARREAHRRLRALPPYPAIICGRFDPFAWAADPGRRSDIFIAGQQVAPATASHGDKDSRAITGAAGALGVVEGTVRRLDSLDESAQLQPGEVLVTAMTNIGWTPLFPRAAAIVTDLGAPLSHAAIVARELGIPAVVGCGDATMRLKTGDRVRVDGGKGLVEIIQPGP